MLSFVSVPVSLAHDVTKVATIRHYYSGILRNVLKACWPRSVHFVDYPENILDNSRVDSYVFPCCCQLVYVAVVKNYNYVTLSHVRECNILNCMYISKLQSLLITVVFK